MAPDVEERLLGGILGEVAVSKDAVRHPVQTGVMRDGQRLEGVLVTLSCAGHEVWVHASSLVTAESFPTSIRYE
jgi:hypothetical protein